MGHVAKEAVLKGYFSKMTNENNFILAGKKKKEVYLYQMDVFLLFLHLIRQ